MILHPDLRALRSDDAPQRDAQERLYHAVGQWRGGPQVAAVLAAVEALAGGGDLTECPALASLFDGKDGRALALDFAAATTAALRAAPLGHVPLRHFTDGTISTLLLARTGNVTLSLIALDGAGLAARPEPTTADFGPSEIWEAVLAGHARGERIACRPLGERQAQLERRPIALAPGLSLHRDASREALLIRAVEGCLVMLRLQRRQPQAGPTREYALADGRLVHQAAGNPRDSRLELMIALLGRMSRADAAPLIAATAREQGSTALRWQALRECLALDTAAGFEALTAIAVSPEDALAPMAGALRSQLIEAHPQLAELEPCPA
ncbi:MAG: hypothetical protein JF595_07545 [Sphingomonadales bacterium]|nr:hypothetical protein [Sphingomonadales bacterium]